MTPSSPSSSRSLPLSLNPYKTGLGLIKRRLMWDLSPLSWHHRKKLKELKNQYEGKKAVILCNGPSLNTTNLSILEGKYTFGLNKINLLFDETSFRPSSIVAVNPYVIEQNSDFLSTTDIPTFLDSQARFLLPRVSPQTTFLHTSDFPLFSQDCTLSIFQGHTVTYVALQLAYHMGFKQVALVGCDHSFDMSGPPNAVTYNEGVDQNHFSDKYFLQNQPWQLPDIKGSEYSYDLARRAYEADGRLIVNASTPSKLDIFPRANLEKFIND